MNAVKFLVSKVRYLAGLYVQDMQRVYNYFANARVQEVHQLDLGAANNLDYQSANKTRVLNKIETRRPSSMWYEMVSVPKGVEILDPDGWDRKHFNYSWYKECITEREYNQRLSVSTLQILRPI